MYRIYLIVGVYLVKTLVKNVTLITLHS